jgi:serine O-acetyltransferase
MHSKPSLRESIQAFGVARSELREDIDRWIYMTNGNWVVTWLTTQGLWVMTQYRFSRWVHYYFHIPVLRTGLKLICAISQKFIELATGVELPNRAEVGGGLFITHANGIIVHINAKIGRHCNLGQQVTIGVGGRAHRGTPVIGDRVFIGPGAKLFGPIQIGNDVAIGANAVVTKPLPDSAVAVGVPAKIVNYHGSQDFVFYRGCPNPPSEILTPSEVIEALTLQDETEELAQTQTLVPAPIQAP